MKRTNEWAVFWAVVAAALGEFAVQLSAGNVPIPPAWAWSIPIIVAAIVAFSPYIKRQ